MWDTIELGSGVGELTAGVASARCGERVLVLEQQCSAGGLTHTFQRHDWSIATGAHFFSGVGHQPGPASAAMNSGDRGRLRRPASGK